MWGATRWAVRAVRFFAELDQHAPGGFRMQKRDAFTVRTRARSFVDQTHAFLAQLVERAFDVGDRETNVVYSVTPAGEELRDGTVVRRGAQQLDVGLTSGEERGPNLLVGNLLDRIRTASEQRPVQLDGRFEIRNRNADVVDLAETLAHDPLLVRRLVPAPV